MAAPVPLSLGVRRVGLLLCRWVLWGCAAGRFCRLLSTPPSPRCPLVGGARRTALARRAAIKAACRFRSLASPHIKNRYIRQRKKRRRGLHGSGAVQNPRAMQPPPFYGISCSGSAHVVTSGVPSRGRGKAPERAPPRLLLSVEIVLNIHFCVLNVTKLC